MDKFIKFNIKNFKKMLYIGIVVQIASYLYCAPVELAQLSSYLIKTIITSLFLLLMIHGAKLNNSTGATKLFSRIRFFKYSEFCVIFIAVLAAVLGLIVMLKTKEFDNSCIVVPAIVGLYSASRAACIYEEELQTKE